MARPLKKLDLSVIPPFPAVLSRVIRLAQDANVSTSEVSSVVREDPGLAARVLAGCRSAYFSRGVAALTIEEAAGRLGIAEINRIALAIGLADFSSRPLVAYSGTSKYFWERSVTTALIMERVAPDNSHSYVTGLMHLVGVWVLNRLPHSSQPPIGTQNLAAQAAAEQSRFGVTYPEAGAAALTMWNFEEQVCKAVGAQLNPRVAEGMPHEGLARDLAIAVCATDLQAGHQPKIPNWLGPSIDEEYLAELVTEVAEKVEGITLLYSRPV